MIHRSILIPLGIGLLYWLSAALSLMLTHGADGVATMWPASGILFAALIVLPRDRCLPALLAAAVGSVAANHLAGMPIQQTIGFTIANMAEATIATTLLRRWCPHRPSFIVPGDVARFVAATLAAATASALIAWASVNRPGDLFLASWFVTVTLGMLIVTPTALIVLAMTDPTTRAAICPASPRRIAALLGMVLVVTFGVFSQSVYPILFLPLIVLLAATYGLGPLGAAAGVAIIAVVAPLQSGLGSGPLQLLAISRTEMSFFLQFYLLMLFGTALPLAALLAARDRLGRQSAASERMHRLLADNSRDVIVRFTLGGKLLYVSPAVIRVLDRLPSEMVGRNSIDEVHPDDREIVQGHWERLLAGDPTLDVCVYRQCRRDGRWIWMEAGYHVIPATAETQAEVVASIRNIDARRHAELEAARAVRRMRESNRLLGLAERAAGVGHWRVDARGESLFWSPEVFRIHGLPDDVTPTTAAAIECYCVEDRARVAAIIAHAVATDTGFDFDGRIVRPGGEIRHLVSRGQPEFDAAGTFIGLFGIIQDITAQVMAEQELQAARRAAEDAAAHALQLVDTDALTGVASRRKAMAALDEAIVASRAGDAPLAIAIFDIDHFKAVNDRHGHAAGDTVLRRIARTAAEAVRPTDLVGRLGGEEFLVLLPGAPATKAVAIAEQLRIAIASSGGGVDPGPRVTVSIGVALLGPQATAATLLGDADRALYRAKAAGRNAARLAA